jgi:hypothetical protein
VDDQEMDDRLMLGWRGFEQAEHQLIDEIRKNEDPLVPLANLLQWAYAIDQWYKNRIADGEKELLRLFGMDSVGRPTTASGQRGGVWRTISRWLLTW